MASIGSRLAQLATSRRQWQAAVSALPAAVAGLREGSARPAATGALRAVADFGANPGNLRMFVHVPERLPPSPALVVVLHGCTQTASGYDVGTGWSALAEREGFILVYPEQIAANNPKSCFNWFVPGDIARDQGEALSIRQMVEHAAVEHEVDRSRIFVTGLSAGGAMAAVMLATYPEVFAGGAIIAGLPYGGATNVQQALHAMFQGGTRPAQGWGDLVRSASPHRGPWPRLSIWHGTADNVVKAENSDELIKQWTNLHGLPEAATERGTVDGQRRDVWRDAAGREILEAYTIAGMGHGTPLHAGEGDDRYGRPGPFLLEAGISSTLHIAAFWGLTGAAVPAAMATTTRRVAPKPDLAAVLPTNGMVVIPPGTGATILPPDGQRLPPPSPTSVGAIIEDALRRAGLMRN